MQKYIPIIFVLLFYNIAYTQFIADNNFQWHCITPVQYENIGKEYYLKAAHDSSIKQSERGFANIIREFASQIFAETVQNETIKLKFVILKDGYAYQREIGLMHTSSYHENVINELIKSLNPFEPARHRDLNVNSLGILYLEYRDGVLNNHRLVNVNLSP